MAMMQYAHTETHTTSTTIRLVTGQLNIAAKTLVIVLVARVHSHDTYLPVVQAQSRYLSRPEFFPSSGFFSENKAKLWVIYVILCNISENNAIFL